MDSMFKKLKTTAGSILTCSDNHLHRYNSSRSQHTLTKMRIGFSSAAHVLSIIILRKTPYVVDR